MVIAIPADGEYYLGKIRVDGISSKKKFRRCWTISRRKKTRSSTSRVVSASYGDVVTVINEVEHWALIRLVWSPTRRKAGEAGPAKPA